MSHRALTIISVFFWIGTCPVLARAQAPSANPPGDTAQAPAETTGQSSGQQAPAKKVWTNDDVSGLREQDVISPSTSRPAKTKPSSPLQRTTAQGKDTKWYRDQITKLQEKIPLLDSQIAELQAAIDGKPTGDGKDSARPRGVKADSWPAEMSNLQKTRSAVLSQIDALYDNARHNGIPDGALPLQP